MSSDLEQGYSAAYLTINNLAQIAFNCGAAVAFGIVGWGQAIKERYNGKD